MAEEDDADSDPGRSVSEQKDRPEDPDGDLEPDLPTGPASESSSIHQKPRKSRSKAQREVVEVVEVLEDLLKASDKERKEAAQKVH